MDAEEAEKRKLEATSREAARMRKAKGRGERGNRSAVRTKTFRYLKATGWVDRCVRELVWRE